MFSFADCSAICDVPNSIQILGTLARGSSLEANENNFMCLEVFGALRCEVTQAAEPTWMTEPWQVAGIHELACLAKSLITEGRQF